MPLKDSLVKVSSTVIRHLLRQQLLLRCYLQQQRVRVRVMIGFWVQGRVKIWNRVGLCLTFAFTIGAIVAGANVAHSHLVTS